MLQPYHQELLVSSLLPGQLAFLGVVEEESLFKRLYRSPELRITRQFDHNCVCTRGAKRSNFGFCKRCLNWDTCMRHCMECLDFSSDPFAFFSFGNFYACGDSFTPHRKRLRENHALCKRACGFSSLSTYLRGLVRMSDHMQKWSKSSNFPATFYSGPCRALILHGVWNKPESTGLKSGTF